VFPIDRNPALREMPNVRVTFAGGRGKGEGGRG
jgi:hypothetical protein